MAGSSTVGRPSDDLVAAAERILASAASGTPAWPEGLAEGDALDTAAVERTLRAGSARFGQMALGLPIAGDDRVTTTWELGTERGGRATLRVALDPAGGAVTAAELIAAARRPPDDAW